MKNSLMIAVLLVALSSNAQDSEFGVYKNGLIYSEASMSRLKHIVDSLNLKFKVCEINKKFKSVKQTKVHYIFLRIKNVSEARKDIDNNIPFEEFIQKYPKAILKKNELVTISTYYDEYDKADKIVFDNVSFDHDSDYQISKIAAEVEPFLKSTYKGKWIYDYNEKTKYSDERIEAFYFVDDFSSNEIPAKYSKWIQYSECLIDTSTTVFKDDAKKSRRYNFDTIPKKYNQFNDYVNKILKRPDFDDEKMDIVLGMDTMNFEKPWKKLKMSKKEKQQSEERRKQVEAEFKKFGERYADWEALRLIRLDSLNQKDPKFSLLLKEAYAESIIIKSSDDEFEDYVGRYISKDAELELKRNRRVVGGCSMDDSPRIHALNIALLSAETTKWEIFLQSHLNIMNDRFDRVSDGSWAQQGRNTYIKELEELNINVLDLVFGISLRIDKPAENHYFGSINRLGRALSESKNRLDFETLALNMIEDNELDDYNRVMIYFLFDNYNYNLKDEAVISKNKERLKATVSKLPDYLSSKIVIK